MASVLGIEITSRDVVVLVTLVLLGFLLWADKIPVDFFTHLVTAIVFTYLGHSVTVRSLRVKEVLSS